MKEGFYRSAYIAPEERNLQQFKGKTLQDVVDHLEGDQQLLDDSDDESRAYYQEWQSKSLFGGFLDLLRQKGVRVSTPEWLNFLQVISKKTTVQELKQAVQAGDLAGKIRLFAQTTLVKDKGDEAAFNEAFNEYFNLSSGADVQEALLEDQAAAEDKIERDSEVEPEIKEQLDIQEVKENALSDSDHDDGEQVHGGKKDQHNDILKKEDLSKQGGGDKQDKSKKSAQGKKEGESGGQPDESESGGGQQGLESEGQGEKGEAGSGQGDQGEPSGLGKGSLEQEMAGQSEKLTEPPTSASQVQEELQDIGYLVGGGKGKSIEVEKVQSGYIHQGEKLRPEAMQDREKRASKVDRRLRYEARPDKASMRDVIRNIRRIILDVSEVRSKNVDLRGTIRNFARRDFRFDYNRERDKQPEIVLFIDVGGPVDEWSPLVKEVSEAMAEGLTKLEIYLFHNNLYGYVWKPDGQDILASSYAKPNSLIDIKSIVKRRKKVIIYGDAEMSGSEFREDGWPPQDNWDRVKKFGMGGPECLQFIRRKADAAVWINPVFRKEWQDRDNSGTIQAAGSLIPMHDLTVGGVEDAIKDLMK